MTKKPAQVFHFDLYGKREDKYTFLNENSMQTIDWNELQPQEPELFFVPKNFEVKGEYDKGFSVNELFPLNGVGLTTAHDEFVIKEKKDELLKFYQNFQNSPRDAEYLHKEFNVNKKTGWDILQGYDNIKNEKDLSKFLQPISYRPFDDRFIFYEDKLVWRTVRKIMNHFLNGENLGIVFRKQQPDSLDLYIFCSNKIISDGYIRSDNKGGESIAPLYLYPDTKGQQSLTGLEIENEKQERIPNLNPEIVNQISKKLGIPFVAETLRQAQCDRTEFAPIDLLDYIYAVLHSPTYREKYKAFLKIDFPRVPYPKDLSTFEKLTNLGSELRQIHLLESPIVGNYITQYPEDGNNVVVKPRFEINPNRVLNSVRVVGKVYINETQYFANVPEVAWNFYIGGYQPAQKWLKDRKNRELSYEDILHYQKIIVALSETDRIMKEIDTIEI